MPDQREREIMAAMYVSRSGADLVEELIERFGSRFAGSPLEHGAAEFIRDKLAEAGADAVALETFTCPGWTRKQTRLTVTAPAKRGLDCIALPYCPPGEIEGPLVFLGDGDPQRYVDHRADLRGAIAMATTAVPRFFQRGMHRCEKLGRAFQAGAVGFIYMRGAPGGIPETGSARWGNSCDIPAIAVSYETGFDLVRMRKQGAVQVRIESTNENHPVVSHNVVAEFRGRDRASEVIVIGAHYDGHDISQGANDNATGVAILVEAAKMLARYKASLSRTVRVVAFAQEEMGLHGAHHHADRHKGEAIKFMLNVDSAARSLGAVLGLQGWPDSAGFFQTMFQEMFDSDVVVGEEIELYADMYAFASQGIPSAILKSQAPQAGGSPGAPLGYLHTPLDTVEKVSAKLVQIDAARVACLALRLAAVDEIPLRRKTPAEFGARLKALGLDAVLRFEQRAVPGEA